MSTVRIQVRRGTAADWTTTNPVLAIGEIGYETDGGNFKIGDGTSQWSQLDFAAVLPSEIQELTQDAVNAAIIAGTGLNKTYDDVNNTLSLDIDDTIATKFYSDTALAGHTTSTTNVHGITDTADLALKSANNVFTGDNTFSGTISANFAVMSGPEILGTATAEDLDMTGNLTVAGLTTANNVIVEGNLVVNGTTTTINTSSMAVADNILYLNEALEYVVTSAVGDGVSVTYTIGDHDLTSAMVAKVTGIIPETLNVASYSPIVSTTATTITLANTNTDTYVSGGLVSSKALISPDLGFTGAHGDGAAYTHAGLVRDATDGRFKFFDNYDSEPDGAIDFTQATIANIQASDGLFDSIFTSTLNASTDIYTPSATIDALSATNVTATGVSASETVSATSVSATHGVFTDVAAGEISTTEIIVNGNIVIGDVSSTQIAHLSNVTSDIQSQLDGKAPLDGPAFTGVVTLPSTTSIGLVNSAEIGFLNGVSAPIQEQIDSKAASSSLSGHAISPTGVHGVSGDLVGTTDIQILSNKSLNLSTNTVTGDISQFNAALTDADFATTAGMETLTNKTINSNFNSVYVQLRDITDLPVTGVELSVLSGIQTTTANLNFTSDVNSPIQAQLDGKAATAHGHVMADVTGLIDELALKAPLDSPTLTGTVILPGTTSVGTVTGTEIGYLGGVTSGIQSQINTKAPSADPTFTGTVSLPSTTSIGTVTSTEIGHLSGVTGGIQSQINGKASLSGAVFTGDITLPANPTQALHAATKQYVDSVTIGLNVHDAVKAATTTNINLATDLENGDLLDGVTLATGMRVLVKNQATLSENGIYTVQVTGAPVRADDYNVVSEVDAGDFFFVEGGIVNGKTGWIQLNAVATLGTDPIEFSQFSGAGTITAGSNISVDGLQVSVVNNPTFSGPLSVYANGESFMQAAYSDHTGFLSVDNTGIYLSSASDLGSDSVLIAAEQGIITMSTNFGDMYFDNLGLQILSNGADMANRLIIKGSTIDPLRVTGTTSYFSGSIDLLSLTGIGTPTGTVTPSQVGYLSGVTSSLQTQLDAKAPKADPTFTGTVTVGANGVAFSDGTQTKQGVPSITTISQKTAAYTLSALSERDTIIEVNSASAVAVTIPPDSTVNYPVGTTLDIIQTGAGQVTIAAGAGVTINATPGLKLRTQWSSVTLLKRAADTWLVYGDLSA